MIALILWGIFFVLGITTSALICFSLPMLQDNTHRFLGEHGRFAKLLSVFLSASVAFFFAALVSSLWYLIFT